MNPVITIAVFDIGKTNKKAFLFNREYQIVHEHSEQIPETIDDDGDACEDLPALLRWIQNSLNVLLRLPDFEVRAVNFSAYGASLIHLDRNGKVVAPLYNYLKAFPEGIAETLYNTYGGKETFLLDTASPALGNLNSGLQLLMVRDRKPELFQAIHQSLHLPQFLSYYVSGTRSSDITSIGCHTALWDFTERTYHRWVADERLSGMLAPIKPSHHVTNISLADQPLAVGIGLHDSSAALVPYLLSIPEPFLLISTGTWSITLNPFSSAPLTLEELRQDCLCYLSYTSKPVKASRLFAGNEHEIEVRRLADHFGKAFDHFKSVSFNKEIAVASLASAGKAQSNEGNVLRQSGFAQRDLDQFITYEEAYHQLIADIIRQQEHSTRLVMDATQPVKKIFVDGGFSANEVFMYMLSSCFSAYEVYASSIPQASALGAALAIHASWNREHVPGNLITLKRYNNVLPPAVNKA